MYHINNYENFDPQIEINNNKQLFNISEASRKYTITLIILRQATKNYKVPGQSLVIEKGQKIIIPIRAVHNDPKYYPNPNTFDPERFSAEEKSKRLNGTYLPFGDGPRLCIGTYLW